MIDRNYQTKTEPVIQDTSNGSQIRVPKDYIRKLTPEIDSTADEILREACIGQAICPPTFWFRDTPEVRRILGLEAAAGVRRG